MSTIFLFAHELTEEDCSDLGWSKEDYDNGLIADVDYIIAFTEDARYFLRSISRTVHFERCEEQVYCLFRGQRRHVLIFWH
jgi:hypothetical protein